MVGRFFVWCLFILGWIAVLGGCYFLLGQVLGLSGVWLFLAQIPVLILLRISVQRFLQKGKPAQDE